MSSIKKNLQLYKIDFFYYSSINPVSFSVSNEKEEPIEFFFA